MEEFEYEEGEGRSVIVGRVFVFSLLFFLFSFQKYWEKNYI